MTWNPSDTDKSTPAGYAEEITPADTDLSRDMRALYIGTGGNLTVVTSGGDTVTFNSVLSGTILPVRVIQVKSTGTTATQIVGLI